MQTNGLDIAEGRNGSGVDGLKGLPNGLPMPTIATKVPSDLAKQIRRAAEVRKITVSAFVRKAVENEMAGGQVETFGSRFGHLAGVARGLPADASRKEGYED